MSIASPKDGIDAAKVSMAQLSATPLVRRQRDGVDVPLVPTSNSAPSYNPSHGPIANNANNNNVPPAIGGQLQVAMFNGLQNASISGGTFMQNNTVSSSRRGLKLLERQVATSAFHNSAQRFDPPRCHPDTRVEILQRIYHWITQCEDREKWLLWLNGAAGAGKSAIVQSIAERCAQATIAIASFFFFRADTTRNSTQPLVATLAYQLIQAIPETSDDILSTIERNPLIFSQSLESQLQELLIQPLLRLPTHLRRVLAIFIDGLDECNDQNHQSGLIKLFSTVSCGRNSPIIYLVASRREPQIEAAFADEQASGLHLKIPLDNSDIQRTSNDIRRFLIDKFTEIKRTHLRKHLLPPDWPPWKVIDEIVFTSSGQFIYASVVINYISSPRANPARRLDVLRGVRLRDASSQNPFAHLDALYQHIFSQVEELDKVLDILAYGLITEEWRIPILEKIFLLEAGELGIYFADLTAVIDCEPDIERGTYPKVKFLHASLPDFLRDKGRSEHYHIDIDECRTKLLCMFLDRVLPLQDLLSPNHLLNGFENAEDQEYARMFAIYHLLDTRIKASDRLQRSFTNFNFSFYTINNIISPVVMATSILKLLEKMDFHDQRQAYGNVLEVFAVEIAKNWEWVGSYSKGYIAKECPELEASICQNLFDGLKL